MDVREKLVEILGNIYLPIMAGPDVIGEYRIPHKLKEEIADHLIANGVTVQEWISVDDMLPTIYDADDDNCVLAIHKAINKRYHHWRSVADNPFDFTYWTRTPQPPRGE